MTQEGSSGHEESMGRERAGTGATADNATRKEVRVLVAHESGVIVEAIRHLIEDTGWSAVTANEGHAALTLLREGSFPVAVVDVGLPGLLGHELCDEIRRLGLPTKVILVASVYQKTAYKRRPSSLYGAADYVEQHHIPDMLLAKIARLVPGAEPPAEREIDPLQAAAIRMAGEGRLAMRYGSPEEMKRGALRLAELIVADVALYHGEEFVAAVRGNTRNEEVMRDLEAGRVLLRGLVADDTLTGKDLIGEALVRFMRRVSTTEEE